MDAVDDDIKPIIQNLDRALINLEQSVTALFDPAEYNEETIPQIFDLEHQARFAAVSAYALSLCLHAFLRISGETVDPKVIEKIVTSKEYHDKIVDAFQSHHVRGSKRSVGKKSARGTSAAVEAPTTKEHHAEVDGDAQQASPHKVDLDALRRLSQV